MTVSLCHPGIILFNKKVRNLINNLILVTYISHTFTRKGRQKSDAEINAEICVHFSLKKQPEFQDKPLWRSEAANKAG